MGPDPWAPGAAGARAAGGRAAAGQPLGPMGPGPWAHGPMISAYFGLFGLISAYLETDSCLFQIIWTFISAYFGLLV